MIINTATVQDIQAAADDPDVKRGLGLPADMFVDMSRYYAGNGGNVAYEYGGNVVLFPDAALGVRHVHFLCGKTKGKELLRICRVMIDKLFTETDASVIVGEPPRDNRAVRAFGTALGFNKIPNSEHTDELGRVCDRYKLERKTWATS